MGIVAPLREYFILQLSLKKDKKQSKNI
jgi:hypothetical protein